LGLSAAASGEDIADLQERVAELEAQAEDVPHRRKYLLLVMGFLRELLELHLQLVDRVERELDDENGSAAAP
jgi:hypothetical protein